MNHTIAIYLAGGIKKGHERNDDSFWTEDDLSSLRELLYDYSISFLNPALRSDDLSDQYSVFGRDMMQVCCSDIVFVDARNRRGLGVGAEMMWAKFHTIPIITLAPKDSHYNKSKTTLLGIPVEHWIHPFVESLSDAIVEDLTHGALWIRKFTHDAAQKVKDIKYIEAAMRHYQDTQLPSDEPMKTLFMENQILYQRIFSSHHKQHEPTSPA